MIPRSFNTEQRQWAQGLLDKIKSLEDQIAAARSVVPTVGQSAWFTGLPPEVMTVSSINVTGAIYILDTDTGTYWELTHDAGAWVHADTSSSGPPDPPP